MRQEFSQNDREVSSAELRQVLEAIEPCDEFAAALDRDIPDDRVTVESISEATGVSPEDVFEILCKVRQQHSEAMLVDRLRKLEEPTFRVERPGHTPLDHFRSHAPLHRANFFSSILEDVVKASRPRIRRHSESDKKHFNASTMVAVIALISALILIVTFASQR